MFKDQRNNISISTLNTAQQRLCLMQINRDIADRSLTGTFIYVVVWFCIAYLLYDMSEPGEVSEWTTAVSLIISITALVRVAAILFAKRIVHHIEFSRALLMISMVVSSLSWGMMAAMAFLETPIANQKDIIFLSTAGLCGGGALSFCASRSFTAVFLICMLLPILVVELFLSEQMDLEAITVICIYFAGLLSVTRHPYREYMSSLINYLKLEEISNTDALTGLKNRRYFDTKLDEELRRASRNHSPLNLLLIDVDHFKTVNDKFGHPVGDKCLTHLAEQLKACVHRVSDTIARIGGEEFALILPNMSAQECAQLAEKMRQQIASSPLKSGQGDIKLTISVGAYCISAVTEAISTESILTKSDAALYYAKRNGRDQVHIYGNSTLETIPFKEKHIASI